MSDPLMEIIRAQQFLDRRLGQTEVKEIPVTIAARYKTSAAQSFATGTRAVVNYDTLDFDTHSRVTTGAAWKFTANAAGYYAVSACVLFNGTTGWVDTESGGLVLAKNGATVAVLDRKDSYGSASTVYMFLSGTDVVHLASGDYLDVRAEQFSGGSLTLFNDATLNWIDVWKL